MDRWTGILKVPFCQNNRTHYRVAASLCLGPSKALIVPSANAIFFSGDKIEGTGNPVIERLSNLQNIAEVIVSKFGCSVNSWVIEASCFNGPFAVYRDFVPSVNQWGEPISYSPIGSPAATSIVTLLTNCLAEVQKVMTGGCTQTFSAKHPAPDVSLPKTCILGFSKGGTVLNQLVTELGFSEIKFSHINENLIIPTSSESLLNSITEIHYVDVGLNSVGAYLNDIRTINRISERILHGAAGVRFVLHGTPRQWCDQSRSLIRKEKDRLVMLLKSEAQRTGGKLDVAEKFYFADKAPGLQMHFEIIDTMDIS